MNVSSNPMKFLLEKTHDKPYSEPEHQHQCYLLVYCKSGCGFFAVNGINIPFKPNTYVVFPPCCNISEIGSDTVCFHLGFDYGDTSENLSYGLFDDTDGELFGIIKDIQQELLNHDSFSDSSIESYLKIIFCYLKRNWHKSSYFNAAQAPSPRLSGIASYFSQHYEEQIDISALFESMGYSYHHLRHVFKLTYGISPAQYLTGVRLEAAEKLLMTTDLPISEICGKTGFKSVSTFNSVFLKKFSVTPEEFRRNSKQR